MVSLKTQLPDPLLEDAIASGADDPLGLNMLHYYDAFERQPPVLPLQAIVKQNPTVLERDDGYLVVSGAEMPFYFSAYEQWPEVEREIIEACTSPVLDVGCGAGRHTLYLQDNNHDVLAIDSSPLALAIARARGVRHSKQMALAEANELDLHGFQTALLLGHNLGLLASGGSVAGALAALAHCVAPGGKLLASTRDPGEATLPEHAAYRARNSAAGRLAGHLRFRVRYRHLVGEWFDFFLATPSDIERMVQGSQWTVDYFVHAPGSQSFAVAEAALR